MPAEAPSLSVVWTASPTILRVTCRKCERKVRYHVEIGRYKDEITADCPGARNDRVALNDLCGAFLRISFSCSLLDGG